MGPFLTLWKNKQKVRIYKLKFWLFLIKSQNILCLSATIHFKKVETNLFYCINQLKVNMKGINWYVLRMWRLMSFYANVNHLLKEIRSS